MIGAVVALAVAAATGPLARWLGLRAGAMDIPNDGLKPHPHPVSYLGGLALAAGVAAGIAAEGWRYPWALPLALFGLAAMGIADDTFGLPPVVRLLAQVGFGALLASQGLRADPFEQAAIAWIVTVLLFAATVNAVNMVDGMDGLAGTATALSGAGLALVAVGAGRNADLGLVLAGAAVGFLVHNRPPARLFMGNGGSYLAGAGLATGVLLLSNSPARFVGAATCLGLFGLDLLLSVIRRLVRREALLQPDRDHLYDQLLRRGRTVWGTLALCAAVHAGFVLVGVIAASLETLPAMVAVAAVWLGAIAAFARAGFLSRTS